MALLAASCGGSSGGPAGSGGASGAAGQAGSAGMAGAPPKSCLPDYTACDCGDQGKGYMDCDADRNPTCNCDAPVSEEPLSHCEEPCGGDIEGDWYLKEICGPAYAKGNCTHPLYESTGTPEPSGFTFDKLGHVTGSLMYGSKLLSQVDQVCANQTDGSSYSQYDCDQLEATLTASFKGLANTVLKGSQCTFGDDDVCACQTDLHTGQQVSTGYTLDLPTNRVGFGGTTLEYCAKKDSLSLRKDADSFTFTYERSRISLPFETSLLDSVTDLAVAPNGLSLPGADCKTLLTLNTDTMTASCGNVLIRTGGTAAKAFYFRSLTVPASASLIIQGDQPALIVAESIDIKGSVKFQRSGSTSAGLGSPGGNQAAGGGGNCTAGGNGGFWTGDTAAPGAAAYGIQGMLGLGGKGGTSVYTYTNNMGVGGAGGGAIGLFASVSIAVSGTIDVSGGDGKATGPSPEYGGGGGAGGTILLQSPKVTVTDTAKLKAVGGRGGGQKGGAGSTASTAPGANGGTADSSTQGGGGGGVGRIAILTDSETAGISALALTPALSACTTIEKLTAR